MQDAMTMQKNFLVAFLLGLCACGQQARSPQSQPATTNQTHTTASPKQGEIVQPAVKPGKIADASSVLISFHGCADLLVTDPRGHKLGYDASAKKTYQEIAGGIYDEGDPISDDEDESKPSSGQSMQTEKQPDCIADKTVQFPNPVAGTYTLRLAGAKSAFKLEITSYGSDAKANGHYVSSLPAGSTPPAMYLFELPPAEAELQIKVVQK